MICALLLACPALGQEAGQAPTVRAKAAVLADVATGEILLDQNGDAPHPPASLTKLMTMHIAQQRVANGLATLDEVVPVAKAAWAQRFGKSSRMFLEPGQIVTMRELLLGMAVCSGNDAATAVAVHVGGSVAEFVELMNLEARSLGRPGLFFVDPHGLSHKNTITARDFALFCADYVTLHPEATGMFHSVKELNYPMACNIGDAHAADPIHQYNGNKLLWHVEGVDGLKTGYIVKSGYNIAITAERGGRRLVAVILEVEGHNYWSRLRTLKEDARALLDWGFAQILPPAPEQQAAESESAPDTRLESQSPTRVQDGAASADAAPRS
jgi:D-alanyl-D-alanine carboxypeptidase (penicillin-binding protein 5/6)